MTMVDIRTPYVHPVRALCVLSIAVALTPRLPDLANPSSDFFTAPADSRLATVVRQQWERPCGN
jgi:hypothetical protein